MKRTISLFMMILFFINCSSQEKVKTISTIELRELLAKENIQLLDVRTAKEIKQGYIKTAKFANYFDEKFYEKAVKLLDKNKPVYLYCRTGNRSGKSAEILQEKGFTVYNVFGGYNQWKQEN